MPFSSSAGADPVHSKTHDLRRNSYHSICFMMRVFRQTGGARADALWPNEESHTIVSRVDWTSDGLDHFPHTTPHQHFFTSNTLPTAHRNISRRTTDAAHRTQESASILPTPCRIFTVTEAGVCRMHVQTPCRIRVYILKNTTAVVPFFRIGQGVSGPVCHKN